MYFALGYTFHRSKRKYLFPLTLIESLSVLLILTDSFHHLMRTSVEIVSSTLYGDTLVVHQTLLGIILVSINFAIPLFSVLFIYLFSRGIDPISRKQANIIVIAMLLTFIAAWVKTTVLVNLEIFISMSVLYTPAALLLFYGLFAKRMFHLSPVARDKIFDVINQGIIVINQEDEILDINQTASLFLGKTKEEVLSKNLFLVFRELDQSSNTTIDFMTQPELEIHQGKEMKHYLLSMIPLMKVTRRVYGSIVLLEDITQTKIAQEMLRKMAHHDSLTGLLNRVEFEQVFEETKDKEHRHCVGMAILDLDHFKYVNDTFGHGFGDEVLNRFASLLSETFDNDLIGRLGGEEFGVILVNESLVNARKILESFRKKVESYHWETDTHKSTKVTVSIGYAEAEKSDSSFQTTRNNADKAMYDAKRISRNTTVIYHTEKA